MSRSSFSASSLRFCPPYVPGRFDRFSSVIDRASSLAIHTPEVNEEGVATNTLETRTKLIVRDLFSEMPVTSFSVAGSFLALGDLSLEESGIEAAYQPPTPHEVAHYHRVRELGDDCAWTVSTAKAGHGVSELRDGRRDTYWQSDGLHPHVVTLEFAEFTKIEEIVLYLDARLDESYSPKSISVRAGSCMSDIREITSVEAREDAGWFPISLLFDGNPTVARIIQVSVNSCHQKGRDVHLRQMLIFGPKRYQGVEEEFEDIAYTQFGCIR